MLIYGMHFNGQTSLSNFKHWLMDKVWTVNLVCHISVHVECITTVLWPHLVFFLSIMSPRSKFICEMGDYSYINFSKECLKIHSVLIYFIPILKSCTLIDKAFFHKVLKVLYWNLIQLGKQDKMRSVCLILYHLYM